MYDFIAKNFNKLLISILVISTAFFIYYIDLKNELITDLNKENTFYKMNKSIETNGEVYMIGNSITASADWKTLLGIENVVNMGSPGITTLDAVMNVEKLLPEKPAIAFIMLGVNDIKVNAPWEVAHENFYNLIYTFKLLSPKTKIIILSVLPTNSTGFDKYQIDNSEIQKLNESLEKLCFKYHYGFINCYNEFLNNNGDLHEKFTYDGLHLNHSGYIKLASRIKQYLTI